MPLDPARLPLRPRPRHGEGALSLFTRLAAVAGRRDIRTFGWSNKLELVDIAAGRANEAVSLMSGVAIAALEEWSAIVGEGSATFRGETLRVPTDWNTGISTRAGRRFCPSCLKDDLDEPDDVAGPVVQRAFIRAWWNVRFLGACLKHRVPLRTTCPDPNCGATIDQRRPPIHLCGGCRRSIAFHCEDVVPKDHLAADRYLQGRLGLADRISVPFLDDMPIAQAADLLNAFGVAALDGTSARMSPAGLDDRETLRRYTGKLVDALVAELERRHVGARRLDLMFARVDNRWEAVRIGTSRPDRDARRLTRLLCDRIETVDPGFGVEVMTLAATMTDPLGATQIAASLIDGDDTGENGAAADIADLIDVLANRVGDRRLYRFAPVASDVPERSVKRVRPLSLDDGASWDDHWPRPARLLSRPEVIDTVALLPDHPPVSFTWRGSRRRVRRADGPERVFGEWWKREAELATVRDYFRVEDEGGERYWIYRSGDGEHAETGSHRWYLHGIFG